jgi:hypothetical protein
MATPKRRPGKFDYIRQPKKRAFLVAFSKCGTVGKAARAAKIDRTNHPLWMHKDAKYAAAFAVATEEAADVLEEEARRRAVDGMLRFKFDKGEPIKDPRTGDPYYEIEYDTTLLIFLLKGMKPEKYRERLSVHQLVAQMDPKALSVLRQELLTRESSIMQAALALSSNDPKQQDGGDVRSDGNGQSRPEDPLSLFAARGVHGPGGNGSGNGSDQAGHD